MRNRTELALVLGALSILGSRSHGQTPATWTQTVSAGSRSYTLQMTRQDLRGANFNVLLQNSTGGYTPYTAGPVRTYLGRVVEDPSANAAGLLQANGLFRSVVYFDRGFTQYFEGSQKVGERGGEVPVLAWSWTLPPGHAGTSCYEYQLGMDVDHSAYSQIYGSSAAATLEAVEFNLAALAGILLRDTLLRPTLGRLVVRTDPNRTPYSVPGGNSNLNVLRNEWTSHHSDALAYCLKVGLFFPQYGGGVAYLNGAWSLSSTDPNGLFITVWRHELGHNWGVYDYEAASPEGRTINCGNRYGRFCAPAVEEILRHRDGLLGTPMLRNAGRYTSTALPPYAALDTARTSQGQSVAIDVLANDHDGNADALALGNGFDRVSHNGGRVALSTGTGPGGRDELIYTPASTLGLDSFTYEVVDSSGQTQSGIVLAQVDEYPSLVHEAESATLLGVAAEDARPGYTGSGYARYLSSRGVYVRWTLQNVAAGAYDLSFRYARASGDPALEVKVNGRVVAPALVFQETANGSTWGETTPLRAVLGAGTNTIQLTATGSGGPYVDHLRILETAPPPSLASAHWKLEGNTGLIALDESPNANHGVLMGFAANPHVAGRYGSGLAFDGIDDRVDVLEMAELPVYGGRGAPYSVCFWLKAPAGQDGACCYTETKASSSTGDARLSLGSGLLASSATERLLVTLCDDRGEAGGGLVLQQHSQAPVFDDTWHHVAWVDSAGRATLYVDGVPDAAGFDYTTTSLGNGTLEAGHGSFDLDSVTLGALQRQSATAHLMGVLDELQVFAFALSPADVVEVMNDRSPAACRASLARFGAPCGPGSLDLVSSGNAVIGGAGVRVQLASGTPGDAAALGFGAGPLAPLDLSALGLPACWLYPASPLFLPLGPVSSAGSSSALLFPIPNEPALQRALVGFQGVALGGMRLQLSGALLAQLGL